MLDEYIIPVLLGALALIVILLPIMHIAKLDEEGRVRPFEPASPPPYVPPSRNPRFLVLNPQNEIVAACLTPEAQEAAARLLRG